MVSEYQSTPSYPDVDEGFFLHESYGKAMFRPTNWKPSLRQDLISYNSVNHEKILDSLHIGPTITANLRSKIVNLVTHYWDVFAPEGICRPILGYQFKIDTGTNKGVCCRPPSYGHYESKIIMDHIKVLFDNNWIRECSSGPFGAPIVLAPKPHQENVDKIEEFVWRMCVSYRALNRITIPFEYPIGRCDDAVEDFGDSAGTLFFISIDCAQGYHQIHVWYKDQDKLAFFAPDGKKYTYTVMPFGPVNAPSFYTAMIRRFQAEWMHLFQLCCNNPLHILQKLNSQLELVTPCLPTSADEKEFKQELFLPQFKRDANFVLDSDANTAPPPVETYTAATVVSQQTESNVSIVSGSKTIIDDILIWSNSISVILLLFECVLQVLVKYRVSLKISKCHLFGDRFEYVGRDILQTGNTTASSKYNLVNDWQLPTTGDALHSFIAFCNFYSRFIPMFQIQCKPLRDLYLKHGKRTIPTPAWSPALRGLFTSLKTSITSSPLLARFDSSKPIFLKTDWSSLGMGYILMQPDDSIVAKAATIKLRDTGECDFDISLDGARLRPILFNSRSCTQTEKHYHGFIGEIACGRWAISMEKRYLWGSHFYWLCDMKTTYKIMHYTGPIHILRRWCQELLAYHFSCLHRSHTMMIDVDYLSRMHDPLIQTHVTIANRMSLSDRAARPGAYDYDTLMSLFQRGKYSLKVSKNNTTSLVTACQNVVHVQKKARLDTTRHPASGPHPVRFSYNNDLAKSSKWRWPKDDDIHQCAALQLTTWLSINRHQHLPTNTEHHCLQHRLHHHSLITNASLTIDNPDKLCSQMQHTTQLEHISVIDCFFHLPISTDLSLRPRPQHSFAECIRLANTLLSQFSPVALLMVTSLQSPLLASTTTEYQSDAYRLRWCTAPSSCHPFKASSLALVLIFSRISYHTEDIQCDVAHSKLASVINPPTFPANVNNMPTPVHPQAWHHIIEFVCQFIVAPDVTSSTDQQVTASVFLTQPSPSANDWSAEYTTDSDCNLMCNHLLTSDKPFPTDLINSVHKCFRAHLREQRIQLLHKKLTCYIPIGGNDRLVMLLIVPKGLRRIIFDAYHASGIGGHLGINTTLTALRLRFLWPDMRADILKWVRSCATCIQANNITYSSRQLLHSWPLLTPFAIISADIWSPGDIVSPTGAKCILNVMCDMTQFVISIALSHVNSAELARAFMESVLLKFGFCLVLVVDDDKKFMAIFESMTKALKIRLHRAAKRNHKAVGVERYHKFLNHNMKIIGNARETHKCFVEVAMVSAYAWNSMPVDGTDIIRSIPAIGRPFRFPMDVAIAPFPPLITDAANSTVQYIRSISKDAFFARELTTWLAEERRQRHRERANSTKSAIKYNVGDMVMARVQVKSSAAQDKVGKLSIESRGPFKITEDHNNSSYTMVPFDKPDGAPRKYMAQDIYALPPQILPCNDIDLPDFRYLNSDCVPVKHPFLDEFKIECYNSMWIDPKAPIVKPNLAQICSKNLPHASDSPVPSAQLQSQQSPTSTPTDTSTDIVLPPSPTPVPTVPRPDTIDEMDANICEIPLATASPTAVPSDDPLPASSPINPIAIHDAIVASKDKLFFIKYRGANTLRPRWYLVQVRLENNSTPANGEYFVDFFRKHPDDTQKKDDMSRFWPDWYEIVWFDKEKTCYDYGSPILVRPNCTPRRRDVTRFSDTIDFKGENTLLVGPFNFAPKSQGIPKSQIVPVDQ